MIAFLKIRFYFGTQFRNLEMRPIGSANASRMLLDLREALTEFYEFQHLFIFFMYFYVQFIDLYCPLLLDFFFSFVVNRFELRLIFQRCPQSADVLDIRQS